MKHISGKHGKSRFPLPRLTVIISALLLISVLAANAAFMGTGYKKGVTVASEFYFSSNVLNSLGDNNDFSIYPCHFNSGRSIVEFNLRNYSRQMIPNPFDVEYKIQYRLASAAGTAFTYRLEYDDGVNDSNGDGIPDGVDYVDVTSTSWSELPIHFFLSGNTIDSDSFVAVFNSVDNFQLPENAAQIQIMAVPVAPRSMSSYILASSITLSDSTQEYHVTGAFEEITNIDDMAGFVYNLTASGASVGGITPPVTITWNAAMLEIGKFVSAVPTYDLDANDNPTFGHITLTVNSGDYYSIPFYRTDNWSADGVSVTLQDLQSYITYQLNE